MASSPSSNILEVSLAAEIVAAYVSHNHVQPGELPKLLTDVHGALVGIATAGGSAEPSKASPQEIERSITPDFLISFEDGRPYKTLRRHLTLRGLSPEAYRAKWGLALDYPMTAQSYSVQRSQLARALGLGQQRRKPAESPAPEATGGEPEQKRRVRRAVPA